MFLLPAYACSHWTQKQIHECLLTILHAKSIMCSMRVQAFFLRMLKRKKCSSLLASTLDDEHCPPSSCPIMQQSSVLYKIQTYRVCPILLAQSFQDTFDAIIAHYARKHIKIP